ncbi:hypothetical protein CPAV1605_987 [seawater metagenome]|uniref:Uncharacterized protein n=1 Tax=seawater metagenome TaxID=1561972 RepID=A0A5E8CM17_9ZZZZ
MFHNKTFNLVILGGFLLIVYLCFRDKKKNGGTFEEFKYIKPPVKTIKSILKKNKCKNINRRVSFILPKEEDDSYVNVEEMEIPKTQFQFPEKEHVNKESLEASKLCMNNKLDLYQSYPGRLEKIKKCDRVTGPVAIKDVYDSLIVDYKRDIQDKTHEIGTQNTEAAAFGLKSFTNTDWAYNNESINNGGKMENGLYANDPNISSQAIL